MSQSLQFVDTNPSSDECLNQEAFRNLRWVTACLGSLTLGEQATQGVSLLAGVAVSHVVTELVDEFESTESFEAWRSSDFVNSVRESLGVYRCFSAADIAHVSSLGGEA